MTLEKRLSELPPGVCWGIATQAGPDRLAQPGQRRVQDFRLGRCALRRALSRAGAACGPVPIGDGGRPRLPAGVTGSLSHAGSFAVAIVGAADRYRSLGVDIEFATLPLAAAGLVLTGPEISWLTGAGPADGAGGRLQAAFSAKESAYKALTAVLTPSAAWLRGIRLTATAGGFLAWDRRRPDLTLPVQQRPVPGGVLTWAWLAAPGSPGCP